MIIGTDKDKTKRTLQFCIISARTEFHQKQTLPKRTGHLED